MSAILSTAGKERTVRGRFEPREEDGAPCMPGEDASRLVVADLAKQRETPRSDGKAPLGSWLGHGRGWGMAGQRAV